MSDDKEPASRPMTPSQGGESGGGPYPNPHSRKDKAGNLKGGQSDQSYYGDGQLGDEDVGGNPNAPFAEDGD